MVDESSLSMVSERGYAEMKFSYVDHPSYLYWMVVLHEHGQAIAH